MSVTLSSDEIASLADCQRVLLSPFDHRTVDEWRLKVNRALRAVIGADRAGHVLLHPDATPVVSEEIAPAVLGDYAARASHDPSIPEALSRGMFIFNTERLCEGRRERFERTWIYRDIYQPNGWYEGIAMMAPPAPRLPQALVVLIHDRPGLENMGERGIELMSMLFPAFRAGIERWARFRGAVGALGALIDSAGDGWLITDPRGRVLHENPALRQMLAADASRERIMHRLRSLASAAGAEGTEGAERPLATPPGAELASGAVRYRASAMPLCAGVLTTGPAVAVSLVRLAALPLSDENLAERYRLTGREIQVARLVAAGCSTAQIAARLGVSANTARHHTEHVFHKLRVRTRAAVGRILQGDTIA